MRIRIIIALALFCLYSGTFAPAMAENEQKLCIKSPFSIFSGKKEKPAENTEETMPEVKNPQTEKIVRPKVVYDPENTLGVVYAENAVEKIEFYIEEEDMQSARETLEQVKNWVYKATEYHTDLYKALNSVNNSEVQANMERELAIKFAVLRDRALFLEAKVLLAEGNKKEAAENLVEVVRSQPGTELGFKAYQALQEIGFTYKIEYEAVN